MVHRRWSNGEWSVEVVARRNRNTVTVRRGNEIMRSRDFEYWQTAEALKEAELWAEVGKMQAEVLV